MDRLDAMNVFANVAELRSFVDAARRLRRSPSLVTRQVAALEEHVGARLLQRTTRSVALTTAGARFLEHVRSILADVRDAEATARAERTEPTGRLAISAPTAFGRQHVGPVVVAYLRAYPQVSVELMLSDRYINLVEEGVDAAVRIGPLDDSSLVARPVGATRRVLVASPEYLASRKRIRSPRDLADADVIQFTATTPTSEWRFVRAGRETRVVLRPRLVTNTADAAVAHAIASGGIAMVLAYQVADAVRAGRLQVLLPAYEPEPFPIHIVYPTTRLLSAKVRAFIDLVSARPWRFVDIEK